MPAVSIDAVSFQCAENGISIGDLYEDMLEDFYSRFLVKGDAAIDGGAHVGRHTLPMSRKVGKAGTVYAFEPAPWIMETLASQVAAGQASNVQLLQFALSDKFGLTDFHYFPTAKALSGIKRRADMTEVQAEIVPVVMARLDQLPQIKEKIRFIKLDLEGGEFGALQGSARLLRTDRPVVIFEFGRQSSAAVYGYTQKEFFQFFKEMNYELLDAFGEPFSASNWQDHPYHYQFVAYPAETPFVASLIVTSAESVLAKRLPELTETIAPRAKPAVRPARARWNSSPEVAAQIFETDLPRFLKAEGWRIIADTHFANSPFLADIDPARIIRLTDDLIPNIDEIDPDLVHLVCVNQFEGLTVRHLRARQRNVVGLFTELALRHVTHSPLAEPIRESSDTQTSRRIALLSLPRSASTVLTLELRALGFGAPDEHVQTPLAVFARERDRTGFDFARWRALLEQSNTVNGLFVTKIIWDLLDEFRNALTEMDRAKLDEFMRFDSVVRIVRRDKVDLAVSDYLAHKTKVWHLWPKEREHYEAKLDAALEDVDYEDLETRYRHFVTQELRLDDFMNSFTGECLNLDFDEISKDPTAAALGIAQHFGHEAVGKVKKPIALQRTLSEAHTRLAEALRKRIV